MERRLLLGVVEHVTKSGYVVVRVADPNMRVRLGSRVVDARGVEVGRLVDLIGNVEEPYAVVKARALRASLAGERVYMLVKAPRKGRRKGRGRPGEASVPPGLGWGEIRSQDRVFWLAASSSLWLIKRKRRAAHHPVRAQTHGLTGQDGHEGPVAQGLGQVVMTGQTDHQRNIWP